MIQALVIIALVLVAVSVGLFVMLRGADAALMSAKKTIEELREENQGLRSGLLRAKELMEKREVLENEIGKTTSGSNSDLANAFELLYKSRAKD